MSSKGRRKVKIGQGLCQARVTERLKEDWVMSIKGHRKVYKLGVLVGKSGTGNHAWLGVQQGNRRVEKLAMGT